MIAFVVGVASLVALFFVVRQVLVEMTEGSPSARLESARARLGLLAGPEVPRPPTIVLPCRGADLSRPRGKETRARTFRTDLGGDVWYSERDECWKYLSPLGDVSLVSPAVADSIRAGKHGSVVETGLLRARRESKGWYGRKIRPRESVSRRART